MISISIDWFQTHNRSTPLLDREFYGNYYVKNLGRVASFKNHYEIFTLVVSEGKRVPGERVATLAAHPDKGILKTDCSFLKIDNKFLNTDLKSLVLELNEVLGLKFRNVSRIDLACDFEKFKKNLDPETFIARFVSRPAKYVKLRKSKFKLQAEHLRVNHYSYIRWGTLQSNLCYYLYNKSKELREVKNKPWIREKWRRDGLDEKKEIWRLEFSIHSCSKGIIDEGAKDELLEYREAKAYLKTTELFSLEERKEAAGSIAAATETAQTWVDNKPEIMSDAIFFSSLDVLDKYEEVFRGLFYHYFDFRYEDGQRKKNRMKKIPLLDLEKPEKCVMNLVDKMESNRTDKMFLSGLFRLNNECRVKGVSAPAPGEQADAFAVEKFHDIIQTMINHFGYSRELLEWVEHKYPEEAERMKVTQRIPGTGKLF